jgi:murein DD-endopeptidase MepM/ murein hydrolase activator NlpD
LVPTPLAVQTASLDPGSTLSAALERLGLGPEVLRQGVEALGRALDLRRLPAGSGIAVAREPRGEVTTLAVRAEPSRFLRVRIGPEPALPRAEVVELPVVTRVETVVGRVTTSVEQALASSPYGPQLALLFADIFQWDVDLLVDPRPGDVVRIVVEMHEVDAPPLDLPPFAGRRERPGDTLALARILAASYDGERASSEAFWVGRPGGEGDYYDRNGAALRKAFLRSPLSYRRISSGFSEARRHPITRQVVPHHGVDFAAAAGTPVVAAADGRVVAAGWDGALGRALRIRHGAEYVTIYGHLQSFARGIRVGTEVRQNEVIGYVGSTGRATGPHLHYTFLERGRAIDPLRFRNPSAQPLPPALAPELDALVRHLGPLLEEPRGLAGVGRDRAGGGAS